MLKKKNWIKQVQKTLTKHTSANVHQKENPAFKLLCLKATELNKHLTDIQAFLDKISKETSSDEDSDEDSDEHLDEDSNEDMDEDLNVDNAEKEKLSLMEEVKRLVEVMGDIAADLKVDYYANLIQSLLYDMKKGSLQMQGGGLMVEMKLDNLSEEQLKLTPFIWFSHFPPEEQGNGSSGGGRIASSSSVSGQRRVESPQ